MKMRLMSVWVAVGVILLLVAIPAMGQRTAIFVQAAAPVPSQDMQLLQAYAEQHGALITGTQVCSTGEIMHAQRITNTYVGDNLSVAGVRRLANALNADHIIIFRIVRWEDQISFQPARSLLVLGATSLTSDSSLKLLLSPIGILIGLQKQATVALFATVFNPDGSIVFTTSVISTDQPFLSIITADPLVAAKHAIDKALYQLTVAL